MVRGFLSYIILRMKIYCLLRSMVRESELLVCKTADHNHAAGYLLLCTCP